MPKTLNSVLHDQIKLIPRHFFAKALEKKLDHEGATGDLKKAAEALSDHLLSGNQDDFVWKDGIENKENLKINIVPDEIHKVLDDVGKFLKDDLPNVVQGLVEVQANSQLRKAKKDWPAYYVWARGQHQIFKDNIELRWGQGLNMLRLMLAEAQQIGQAKLDALIRSKAKKSVRTREVTILLHVRACQTTSEIITLLENGYADGAMARWRTLYELRVVAEAIDKFGDGVAERYIDHEHVSRKREMDNDLKHPTPGDKPPVDQEIQTIINENFEEVVKEYGPSFATPYGWASDSLKNKKPSFRDLEAAIGLPELPPNYKMASYRVHAGVAGLFSGLGTFDSAVPIAGASNAGLQVPAINAAYTLIQSTGLLFRTLTRIEDQIHLRALTNIRDEIEKEFLKSARKLERDELKIRRKRA